MATYTRAELIRDTLIELGICDANEAPEAEDYQLAERKVQQKLEALYEEGLIPFDLDGEIPARFKIPLVQVLADVLVPSFGLQYKGDTFAMNSELGMRSLWKLRDRAYTHAPTQTEYF